MPTKSNGEWIPGAVSPLTYPPFQDSVAQHGMSFANGVGNPSLDSTPPAAVTLSLGSKTTTTVVLNWTAATDSGSGVASYDVYKAATKVTSVTNGATTYTVTGLTTATAYTFSVKAVDGAGNVSAPSNTLNVTTS